MTVYLFDVWNVIALADHKRTIDALVAQGAKPQTAKEFFRLPAYQSFSRGELEEQAYVCALNEEIGVKLPLKEWRRMHDAHIYAIDTRVMSIVDGLAAKKNRIGFVTNTNPWQTERIEKVLVPIVWNRTLASYGPVFRSEEMHLFKTDDAFFPLVLNAMGIEATDAVFIDDFRENVKKAESYGIRSILYKDPAWLKRELEF